MLKYIKIARYLYFVVIITIFFNFILEMPYLYI